MRPDELSPKQRSVLYVLLHLERRMRRTVSWNVIDNCFDDVPMPSGEGLDEALKVLERARLVRLQRPVSSIITAELTDAGRDMAGNIRLRHVACRINPKVLQRLSRELSS